MTIQTGVTKIILSADERDILRKALETLREVNNVIDNNKVDYVTTGIDMDLYDGIYDEINRIENYITLE